MKIKSILTILLISSKLYAQAPIQDYIDRLNMLGSSISSPSEAGGDIRAEIIEGAEEFVESNQFDCKKASALVGHGGKGDCLLVIRSNKNLALNVYFNEIVAGDENKSVRMSMKSILRTMDDVYLYAIGVRRDREDYEVSSWCLLVKFKGQTILLRHHRVYT